LYWQPSKPGVIQHRRYGNFYSVGVQFGSPALGATLKHMAMVEKSVEQGRAQLISRNGNPFASFADLAQDISAAVPNTRLTVLDGEIVCVDKRGKPQFRDLLFRRVVRPTTVHSWHKLTSPVPMLLMVLWFDNAGPPVPGWRSTHVSSGARTGIALGCDPEGLRICPNVTCTGAIPRVCSRQVIKKILKER
jgi:hypothetical protein